MGLESGEVDILPLVPMPFVIHATPYLRAMDALGATLPSSAAGDDRGHVGCVALEHACSYRARVVPAFTA